MLENLTTSDIGKTLSDIDKILGRFYERIKGTEQEVKTIKQSLINKPSTTKRAKQGVSRIVRVSPLNE